jgi:tetratricopeptide (TPR) repeat protein
MARAAGADQVSESPTDRMIALNRRAFADIQSQHFQAAKYWLDEALVISETAGLDDEEMTARTYVHLAAVSLGGPKDRDEALRYLELALKINPNIALTPGLEIVGLRSAYLQARERAALPPNPDPTAPNFDPSLTGVGSDENEAWIDLPTPPAPATAPMAGAPNMLPPVRDAYAAALTKEPDVPARLPVPIYCVLPLDLLPGQDLVVRCVTQKQMRKSSATFHYRPDGAEVPFAELPMDRSPKGWLVAVLPAKEIQGKALSYYVTAQLPNVQQPLYLAYPEAPRALSVRADLLGGAGKDTHPNEGVQDSRTNSRSHQRRGVDSVWFALGAGSGVVYHGRTTVDSREAIQGTDAPATVNEGFSPASLMQIEPEVGYQVTRRLSVSLMARYQYAPIDGRVPASDNGKREVLTSAFALFLQGRLTFATNGNLQTYATGAAGSGRSFLAVIDRDCQARSCWLDHSDTVHGGSAALAVGAGMIYHLGPQLALFAEAREIATLPTFMALTEINLGFAVAMQLGRASIGHMAVTGGEGETQ